MNNQPFLSVIIPVYNIEKYLRRAMDSVLAQTFSDFQIILVDDCSSDSSGSICDEYANCEQRVQVIHLSQNGGVSNARNQGILSATGRYITFVDADDYLDQDIYERVSARAMAKNFPKVLVWGLIEEYSNNEGKIYFKKKISWRDNYFGSSEDVRRAVIELEQRTLYGYVWNKFYDLQYIKLKNLHFDVKIKINEDFLFNMDYFTDINSMIILDISSYHYIRYQNGSATTKFIPDYFENHRLRIAKLYDQMEMWTINDDYVKSILSNILIRYIFSSLERNYDKRAHMNYIQRRKWLINLFQDQTYVKLIPFARPESRILKIMYSLLKHQKIILCLLSAHIMFYVKKNMPGVFSKLKQNR